MKNKQKQPTKPRGRKPRAPRQRQNPTPSPYQSLLADPCSGPLHSPYGGERGIVERFVADYTFGSAGNTCGVAFVQPNNNAYGGFVAATSSTATLVTGAPAVAPGFFNANVQKARCIACCLELIPASLSITNITGELAMGVFDSRVIGAGLTLTVDQIFALCNDREVIQKKDYEIKWYPGAADNLYNVRTASGGALIPAEDASQNEVVIAWRGVPAGTLLSFRITTVYEWTPVPGLGLAATSSPGYAIDWQNQSAGLHQAHPSWWTGKPKQMTFAESYQHAAMSNKNSARLYKGLTDYKTLIPQVLEMAFKP